MTYDVKCPECGLLHTLQESDLGVKLVCEQCNGTWVYDEPLKQRKAQAKAVRIEAKRHKVKSKEAARDEAEAWSEIKNRDQVRRAEEALKEPPIATVSPLANWHGAGCQRCGSMLISQNYVPSIVGIGLFVFGVISGVLVAESWLTVCVLGLCLWNRLGVCQQCGWVWHVGPLL